MEQPQENQFNLAQYVLENPAGTKDWQFYDGSPALLPLFNFLKKKLGDFLSEKENLANYSKNPGCLVKYLAQEADQFYPSRTASDMLSKALIIDGIMRGLFNALMDFVTGSLQNSNPTKGLNALIIEAIVSNKTKRPS